MKASGLLIEIPARTGSRKLQWFTASRKAPSDGIFSTP
jgi:hypothetical protein